MQVSIIIPTRNEAGNIGKLLQALTFLKSDYNYEAVVVDDSDDNTASIALRFGARVIKGKRKGLGQAIVDGIYGSKGEIVLVMDADLSHNPKAIPNLLNPILSHGYDMTIGSRYVQGGDFSNWSRKRQIQSLIGVKLMQLVTGVKDSNSGFFAFRKPILHGVTLNADSWKIMLEVLFKGNWISKLEVPIQFNDRTVGVSKNNNRERVKHAIHLMKLLLYKTRRFWKFVSASGVGTVTTFVVTWICTSLIGLHYLISLGIATSISVIINFTLNSKWTFSSENKAHSPDYEWRSFYKGLPWQKLWKQKLARIVKNMAGDAGNVLDIGCGSSPLGILTNHNDYKGIDIDVGKIAFMDRKGLRHCRFMVAGCDRIPYLDESFETVLFIEVIEHLDKDKATETLKEIYRVLKVKGQAIIATPNYGSWAGRMQDRLYGIFQRGAYADEHQLKFTLHSLIELCRENGLQYVKSEIPANSDMICKFVKVA